MIMKSISSQTRCIVLTTVAMLALSNSVAFAGDAKNASAPDNSAANTRANNETGLTAESAGNSKSDVKLTAEIRQALVKDKNLSTYAHNVKIITENGQVVLKGPVKSMAEKQDVEGKAGRIAGTDRVRSELEVAK